MGIPEHLLTYNGMVSGNSGDSDCRYDKIKPGSWDNRSGRWDRYKAGITGRSPAASTGSCVRPRVLPETQVMMTSCKHVDEMTEIPWA